MKIADVFEEWIEVGREKVWERMREVVCQAMPLFAFSLCSLFAPLFQELILWRGNCCRGGIKKLGEGMATDEDLDVNASRSPICTAFF